MRSTDTLPDNGISKEASQSEPSTKNHVSYDEIYLYMSKLIFHKFGITQSCINPPMCRHTWIIPDEHIIK